MTITLGLAWALFVLAPGLAVFSALYTTGGSRVVAPAPPAPSSFTALSIVIFGALAAHALGSGLFFFNDLIARHWSPIRMPWEPNPYAYFLSARPPGDKAMGAEAFSLMTTLLVLSVIAHLSARWAVSFAEWISIRRFQNKQGAPSRLFRFLYGGWVPTIIQLRKEAGFEKHLAAYVVTDMRVEDRWIGYEGEVENLTLDTDKQIVALTLRNCKAFRLIATRTGLSHRVVERSTSIPRLLIERAQIKNIAFEVVFKIVTPPA